MAVSLISIGLISNFFGGRLFHIVFALVAGTVTFIITILLSSLFGGLDALTSDASSKKFGYILLAILCFLLSIGLAAFVGFLTTRFKRFGPSLLGAVGGFIIGLFLYTLIISKVYESLKL